MASGLTITAIMPYLDCNATTKPDDAVVEVVARSMRERWHNPSSIHRPGQAARSAIELARKHTAALINATPREVIFTASGTESVHLAIRGVLWAARSAGKDTLLTTDGEHSAIRELLPALEHEGFRVHRAPIGRDGLVNPDNIHRLIDARTALVSVHWANNETGVIQPVADIRRACAQRGVAMHTDATQWVGKMPCSVKPMSPGAHEPAHESMAFAGEFLTFSPHKFHGPRGVGVLFARQGAAFSPVFPGSQELGRRGGTEAAANIEGAGVACQLALQWLEDPTRREAGAQLRDQLEQGLLQAWPGAQVNGSTTHRLWNTTNIHFPGTEAEALLLSLSERGVCASAGAACSSGSLEPSPVLLAMGLGEERAGASLRFSLSRSTMKPEIESAIGAVADARNIVLPA